MSSLPAQGGGSPVPAPWVNGDVGTPGVTGSASYAGGVFQVKGAGADIWDSTDAFHFAYQPLAGNGEVVAQVLTIQNTGQFAKAGVMLRRPSTTCRSCRRAGSFR
jgi:hypothetical protein